MINLGNGKYRPLEEINNALKLSESIIKYIEEEPSNIMSNGYEEYFSKEVWDIMMKDHNKLIKKLQYLIEKSKR